MARSHVENGIPGSPDGLGDQMGPLPEALARRLGIEDPVALRSNRKAVLEKRLADASISDAERAALSKRIAELAATGIQVKLFRVALPYRFAVNGTTTFADHGAAMSELPDEAVPWPIDFFMGAWDADALCGYMSGHWDIIMKSRP